MSSFGRDNAFHRKNSVRRPFVTFSAIALACMSAISSQAKADDELLQFEQVAPRSTVDDVAAGMQSSAQAGTGSAKTVSPSAVVRSVRESLAVPVSGGLVEDVLVFERLPVGRADVPEVTTAATENAVVPLLQLSAPQPVPGGTAAVALAAGKGQVPESELRDLFLSMVDAAAGRSPAVAGALAQYAASKADIAEAKGQRYPQLDISARGLSREFGAAAAGGTADPSLTLGITTTLFDWGRVRKTIEARTHLADAADSAVQAQLESSAYDVTSNLVELAKQRIVVET
ncbi:MAG: TolC family protein, partial [Bacteroides sp.]